MLTYSAGWKCYYI